NEHTCEVASVVFLTGLSVCPICHESLDVAPSFPSTVADYLRRTKTANKTYATFDYETELFVPIDDGEFVVITGNDGTGRTFLIPRSPRLSEPRDFYELYQDYYHCAAPKIGAINVTAPAVVSKAVDGWKLEEPGIFEMFDERKLARSVSAKHAKQKHAVESPALPAPAVEAPAPQASLSTHARDTQKIPKQIDDAAVPCEQCQTPIEPKYAFCWKCGHERGQKKAVSADRPERLRLIVPAGESEEEPGKNPQRRNSLLSRPLSWAASSMGSPARKTGTSRSVLKLFAVAVVGLLLFSVITFALVRSRSSLTEATVTQAVTGSSETVAPIEQPQPKTPSSQTKPTAPAVRLALAEDAALERLRQMRTTEHSDRSKMLQKFSETERKYATDYRFPYERARVLAMDRKKKSHGEAFAALARAVQVAIHSGKATEMLQNMNKDSAGDFQNLSHGYREWAQLQKALKTNDASVVSEEAL
ncbi:MAG TPA: hypothetical protein VL866_17485, partial [Pyrinomonadaceae bacterium]|nr:hypothetical protein [Pyrinomonadaceae bacterium]